MPEDSLDRIAALKSRGQRLLIEFLHADLDLAFTFLQTAMVETGSDIAHAQAALQKADTAVSTIRQFQGRIEDPTEWRKIQSRTDDLEAKVSAFRKSD